MSDDAERLGEALFILSDRLRAAGLIVAGNPVADAYDTVVKEWTALTASRSYSDEIVEGLVSHLEECAEAAANSGSDFNQGVVRGLEIAKEQVRLKLAALKVQTGERHG